jgi:hypothetical protein
MAGMLVVVTVVMTAVVVGAYLLWRYGRRKWRAFHSHGAVVGAKALWEVAASSRLVHSGPRSTDDVHQWTPRQVRREMWRSVDHAQAAVRAANDVGAPTASLPTLCRRLHEVAIGLDQVLRVETTGAVPAEVATQACEVMRAASDVQAAAVASASDANGQRVRDLAHDADHEIQLLGAGLASARAVLPHPDR